MRRLHSTTEAVAWLRQRGCHHLRADSRQVRPGDGFVAWPGAAADGRHFVAAALKAGAAACLVESDGAECFELSDPRVALMPDLKPHCAHLAAEFYRHPSEQLALVGITGTNGKTSSAWWLAQLLDASGWPCAVVGTLGIGQPGGRWAGTGLTTPDPFMFQGALRGFVDQGLRACALEASSIGLKEGRLDATRLKVAVFTNFTQDHLDYHGSMAAYWQAKRALFDWPGLQAAVINIDDPRGMSLSEELTDRQGLDVWTVSMAPTAARLACVTHAVTATGMRLQVVERGDATVHSLELPLIGDYNVSNLLGVLAAARALDVPLTTAVAACQALTPVPGRMQAVPATADAPLVLVDYAHTPDALDKALHALRPLSQARQGHLWCVVGCGGDRDPGKRPLMAAAAERGADRVVLTSDNPRSEDPQAILAQMLPGLRLPQQVTVQSDRAAAIEWTLAKAQARDVVLIAGKGHEDYQEVAGVRLPFSDVQVAREALARRPVGAVA